MENEDRYQCEDCGQRCESAHGGCPTCGSRSIFTIQPSGVPHLTGKPIGWDKPAVITPGHKIRAS